MGKYIPNMVVRKGEITKISLIKLDDPKKNAVHYSARRINQAMARNSSMQFGPYFGVRNAGKWTLYRAEKSDKDPGVVRRGLSAAAVEMYLRHRSG